MSGEGQMHSDGLRPRDVAIMKDVAEQASKQAVESALIAVGIDTRNPIDAQKNFGVLRELADKMRDPEFLADIGWVRRTRRHSEGMVGKALLTAMGLAVIAAAHAIWVGVKALAGGVTIAGN